MDLDVGWTAFAAEKKRKKVLDNTQAVRYCRAVMKNTAAQSLGRLGGSKTSEAKTIAARANATKGGKPAHMYFAKVRYLLTGSEYYLGKTWLDIGPRSKTHETADRRKVLTFATLEEGKAAMKSINDYEADQGYSAQDTRKFYIEDWT